MKDPGDGGNRPGAWSDWLESNVQEANARDERWRPVVGYEGAYEVSDRGRVRSLDRVVIRSDGRAMHLRGRLLRPSTRKLDGRHDVALTKNHEPRTWPVARLVMEAFAGPRPDGKEVLHGPRGAGCDELPNLSWGTHRQNMLDKMRDGTDYNRNLTHCPRNHLLAEPTLVACMLTQGYRSCLACARARAAVQHGRKYGRVLDFETVADEKYAKIMGA